MNRKTPSPKDRVPSVRGRFALWALAAFCLLLAAEPHWPVDQIQLLRPADRSLVAAGDIWNPFLSQSGRLIQLLSVPYWIYAAVAGILLAWLAIRAEQALRPIVVGCFLVGISSLAGQISLPGLLGIALVGELRWWWSRPSAASWGLRQAGLALAVFVAVALVSLECGMIAMLILFTFLIVPAAARHKVIASGIFAGWLLLLSWFVAGYAAMLLRPWLALWQRPPSELMPSMQPLWEQTQLGWLTWFLIVPLAARWRQQLRNPEASLWAAAELALLTVLGVASGRYVALAAGALMATSLRNKSVPVSNRLDRLSPRFLLTFAGLMLVVEVAQHGMMLLAADTLRRSIDPVAFGVKGPVLLTNLDQARQWQNQESSANMPLLVSDRWDVYGDFYPDYQAICEDWFNWRREAYKRRDGTWGGYGDWFDEWKPALLVVPSQNLDALRLVSINTAWRVAGLDSQRVIYAESTNRQAMRQLAQAAGLLGVLEVPRPAANVDFEQAIVFGSRRDVRRVSEALTALRMPFAAMRVLPADRSSASEAARIWALLELSHRTQRYTGQPSLLNQCRAMFQWKQLEAAGSIPPPTAARFQRAKDALDQMRTRAGPKSNDANGELLEALLQGDADRAGRITGSTADPAERRFFQSLADAPQMSVPQIVGELRAVEAGLPPELRDECLYYMAMLSIEIGDFATARETLQSLSADSPYTEMARYYLSLLG